MPLPLPLIYARPMTYIRLLALGLLAAACGKTSTTITGAYSAITRRDYVASSCTSCPDGSESTLAVSERDGVTYVGDETGATFPAIRKDNQLDWLISNRTLGDCGLQQAWTVTIAEGAIETGRVVLDVTCPGKATCECHYSISRGWQ